MLRLDLQGLGQCRRYIATHYPQAKAIPINSTAAAAQKAASDPASLAISSRLCAEVYGLDIVDTEIQDGHGGSADASMPQPSRSSYSC